MFFDKNKNSHPAASGRFASYGEIVSNFACLAYNAGISKPDKTTDKTSFRFGKIYYFFAVSAVSLIIAVIITVFLNAAAPAVRNPFEVSAEYLILWLVFFFILSFAGNKISALDKNRKNLGFIAPGGIKNASVGFTDEKAFKLGILKGAGNKKYPDVLIGLDEKKRFEHTLIVSPTGGGKTSRYIVPGIAADARYSGVSVFAIDIDSPYLYESVKKDWIKAGKTVIYFDPYEPETEPEPEPEMKDSDYNADHSAESGNGIIGAKAARAFFNPLTGKDKNPLADDKLLDISSILFHLDKQEIKGGDVHAHKYYSKRSSDLFYGCLLYLKYKYGAEYFDLVTVKAFFERGVKFIEEEIKKFNGENVKKIKILFNNFLELPVYERAKIVTDILNNLDFLSDPNVASHFRCKGKDTHDCFFIGDFFAKDMLFIAGIPKEKINSGGDRLMSFITRIFINAVYEDRRKKLREENKPDTGTASDTVTVTDTASCNSRSIFMYLDEFPALSLNDFDIELANLRKTNTGVCLTVQDIAFLKDRYGDTALITSNIGTHIVMGHAGYETCRYYSEISGEKYVFHKERVRKHIAPVSKSFPDSTLADYDYGETPVASGLYPLISPDELKNMDGNSVFIYTKFVNPFILNQYMRQ